LLISALGVFERVPALMCPEMRNPDVSGDFQTAAIDRFHTDVNLLVIFVIHCWLTVGRAPGGVHTH
jgi:hypothetical protein